MIHTQLTPERVAGTEVYSVNLTNAVLTPLFDYSLNENGQALGGAFGSAFINEASAVPEPGTMALLGSGLVLVANRIRRRRSKP